MRSKLALQFLRSRKLAHAAANSRFRNAARRGVFPSIELEPVIPDQDLQVVVDVGANRGQFFLLARRLWPSAMIYCFEPGLAAFNEICSLTAAESNVHIEQLALGERDGEAELLVAKDDDSSSLLVPTERQIRSAPGSRTEAVETVQVVRGETYFEPKKLDGASLLKLDVQGAELDVLSGFGRLLQSFDFILLELSLLELYEGQATASDLVSYLSKQGFELARINPPTQCGREQTQFDGLFRKTR